MKQASTDDDFNSSHRLDGFDDTAAAWYSSESAGNEPQLIVQYSEAE